MTLSTSNTSVCIMNTILMAVWHYRHFQDISFPCFLFFYLLSIPFHQNFSWSINLNFSLTCVIFKLPGKTSLHWCVDELLHLNACHILFVPSFQENPSLQINCFRIFCCDSSLSFGNWMWPSHHLSQFKSWPAHVVYPCH